VSGGESALLEALNELSRLFPECAPHGGGDLKSAFEEALKRLELLAGSGAESALDLSRFDGVDVSVRSLSRARPLETKTLCGVKVPTEAEALRLKAWLVVTRNSARDYADFAGLCGGIPKGELIEALLSLDACYPQPGGEGTVSFQLIRMLSDPKPFDLKCYVESAPDPWESVRLRCLEVADLLFDALMLG